MLPIFPIFKKIDLNDKLDIESILKNFPPYSDYNFTSLWSWDYGNAREVSLLNGNLVILFNDYSTEDRFLSFLGDNLINETVSALIDYAELNGLSKSLILIPETSVRSLNNISTPDLNIVEDRDHFDHVYSTKDLANYSGTRYHSKRISSKKFLRTFPDATYQHIDLAKYEDKDKLHNVLIQWDMAKKGDDRGLSLVHERSAINRLLESSGSHSLILSRLKIKDGLIGFGIDELLWDEYAISHFFKVNPKYSGSGDFLTQKIAEYLSDKGARLWNWEQDLGIDSLKRHKLSYRPIAALKKYRISRIA